MLSFFDYISDVVSTLFNFFVNMISSLISLVTTLVSAITVPQTLSAFVPGFLGSCIFIVVAIGVLKLVVGWGNNQ